ncbi:SAM-dependent methyltransferase [Rhizocola hellebori]|uniref:SAM-dependent methyltransferase n=1 Tax=Rhizocola hellebori TaxID=1392758 RepID=A0A8J3VG97_9ACTN|nr:class I SAM-dependent methyltransferase [Rhizocola hellebori]GIH05215.1 SAM-dependent methyltransferase [Rhizocola hellebori]
MIDMTTLDPAKLEAAAGKTFAELGVGVTGPLMVLGDRLGLWAALASSGPVTPAGLAERTGLHERYLREWLRAVSVAGYLDYDPGAQTFTLSGEMAAVLATDDSPASMIGVFSGFIGLWADLDRIEDLFRTGAGLSWGDHHPALSAAQERFTRPMYEASLAKAWLPAADGVDVALRAGGSVLDIGCGYGVSTLVIASGYPQAKLTGVDSDDGSVAHARKAAAEAGLAQRVTFEVADASSLPGSGWDVAVFTDSLHDMGDPVGALKEAQRVVAPSGTVLIIEPLAADRFEDDFSNPYARIGYAISTMACTPSSLSQPVGAALGAMAGEAKLREVAAAAGFERVERIAADAAPFNIILAARP